jgi:hypothetical protein
LVKIGSTKIGSTRIEEGNGFRALWDQEGSVEGKSDGKEKPELESKWE